MIFLNVVSRSPFRITVATDVAPDTTPGNYSLVRQDNVSSNAFVAYAFLVDANTVELAIGGDGLVTGAVYVLSDPIAPGAPSAVVAYRSPLLQSQVPVAPAEDPETEAFGVDIDWLADALTAFGDTPSVRGRQCLINDLAVIAMINPGELFHRPDAGAGLKLNVNAPMTSKQVSTVTGALVREWSKDARVSRNGATVKAEVSASTGRLTVFGTIIPAAIDDPLIVKLPGGGT